MSKLLGSGPLVIQSQYKVSDKPGPGQARHHRRLYICRRCSKEFDYYPGIKQIAPGIGLCKEHNPDFKP